jgi:cullin 3
LTDLSVRVLTTGYWPGQNSPPIINLPRVPAAAFDVFKNFYLGKHSGRVLTLQPSAGTADLNAIFYGPKKSEASGGNNSEPSKAPPHRKHIICVNTYQVFLFPGLGIEP